MSASLAWIAWNFEIGWPNALRSFAYASASSKRALREPEPHRRDADAADVEHVQELLEAVAARAEQVVLRHAAVGERERARVGRVPAHLAVGLALLVAGRAVGDDQVGDLVRRRSCAVMQTTPEMSVPALVMNCFAPSITHSPSSSRARVLTLPASEPASGSVSPKAPRISPAHSRGSHSALCSSLPNR